MEFLETVNNDITEDENAMETELEIYGNDPIVLVGLSNDNRLSQASTIPIEDEIIQINMVEDDEGEIRNEVISETEYIIDTITERTSPALSQNGNSYCNKNNYPSVNHDNDPNKSPVRRHNLSDNHEDDGMLCPICLDSWTNSGNHRVCSLKCGHLFGFSCINRWLDTEKKLCPTCKRKVGKYDIRYIYAKKLLAMDTTEFDKLKTQLELVTEEKNKIQLELTKTTYREHALKQQMNDYKKKIQMLQMQLDNREAYRFTQNSQEAGDNVRLYMDKSLQLSKDGDCRVLDCKSSLDLVVTSMKSSNAFFTGYGIRKINISNYKPTAFIGLHKSQIRDLKIHPQHSWLLSVSLDKDAKILDLNTNNTVASFTSTSSLWSCCWDSHDSHMLYVGDQLGIVAKYDVRQMIRPITTLSILGDRSGVTSLATFKQEPGSVSGNGIICCKLTSVWIFENTSGGYSQFHLPVEGPFVSMSYQNNTSLLLVSARPNSRIRHARHVVCCLNKEAEIFKCDTIHTFTGSVQNMSRSCLLSNKNLYVAAHHESDKCVNIWNVNTGNRACSVPARDSVLDLCELQTSNAQFLLSLTENKLDFFKLHC